MSQAIKDWIEQDREQIIDDYSNGDLTYEGAIRALERLGFGTQEARDMLQEEKELYDAGAGGLK